MITYQPENSKYVYTIDSEGTLYFTPLSESNAIRLDDWVEVEPVDEFDDDLIEEIQDALIAMNKAIGVYFQQ